MNIRLLVLDVDGVLTDNTFWFDGDEERKRFCAADGLGLRLLQDAGVAVALLTGRSSAAVARRAAELGIATVLQGRSDKAAALDEIRGDTPLAEIAYMGDDLVDLPAMRRVGFAAAPADARTEARDAAHWTAPSPGGRGAVRDLCEHLLKARGAWDDAVRGYLA